ncbi:unnamed protein product [Lactuca virosa]|uniref:Uncharacterized protein n=1 Tax=Lactuca virosa TaxID=75947 RepID=A0AAU9PA77_9ASTR|nr:unnamed protein product [Lactuca virosa]
MGEPQRGGDVYGWHDSPLEPFGYVASGDVRGKNITILDRLHRKQIANSTLVTEEVMEPDSPTRGFSFVKPESETIAGGLSEKIPEDPLSETENPNGLSAAVVFQQKLFGSRLGRFMASTIETSVVVLIPISFDTKTGNEEPVGIEYVDMEATIVITRKEAIMSTLVTLAASLPRFQHPFFVTSVANSPFETWVASDEEALDKAQSCLMEGMHLLNEVPVRTKAHSDELAQLQIVFDEALEELKQLRILHELTKKEAKGLREEVVGLSERNQSLVIDLSQTVGQQEELKKLSQDLQLKLDDAMSHRASAVKELEGVSQQYHSHKSQYMEKVSQLEIACSNKDVCIKLLEEDLVVAKLMMLEKDARFATLSDPQLLMEQNIASCQMGADQKAEEMRLVIKECIAIFVWALLDSSDFGAMNSALQTSAIQLGLHQACVDMKEKYPGELKEHVYMALS